MKKLRLRRLVFAAFLCVVTQPGIARADDIDQLYEQGQAAFEKQSYAEAHKKLSAVWAARQSYDVATVLSQAEVQLGKHRDAAEHLAYAVAHFPVSAKIELRKQVEAMFADARTKVGAVRLTVTPANASVTVNGRVYGEAERSGPIFVDPGKVTIEANAPGHVGVRRVLEVAKGGEAEAVSLTLAPATTPAPSVIPVIALGAVAVAGLGVGIGATVVATDKGSEAARLLGEIRATSGPCNSSQPAAGCATLFDVRAQQSTLSNAAVWSFVGAGAAAVAAGAYIVISRRPWDEKKVVLLAPTVGAGFGGLEVRGAW